MTSLTMDATRRPPLWAERSPGTAAADSPGRVGLTGLINTLTAALDDSSPEWWRGLQSSEARVLLTGVNRVVARLGAHQVAAARELERAGAASSAGASSTGALIAQDFGGDRRVGNELIRAAQALEEASADATEVALAAGEITTAQATIIGRALAQLPDTLTPEQRRRCERAMVADAQRLSLTDLRRRGDRLIDAAGLTPEQLYPGLGGGTGTAAGVPDGVEAAASGDGGPTPGQPGPAGDAADGSSPVLDPDAYEAQVVEARERRAWRRTELYLRNNTDGTWTGRFTLPDLQAELLKTLLEAHAAPRRRHLRPTGPSGSLPPGSDVRSIGTPVDTGHDAGPGSGDELSYPQRMGQALVALIEHTPTDGFAHSGGTPAVLAVTLDHDTLLGQLADAGALEGSGPAAGGTRCATVSTGTRISAGQARRLACQVGLIPHVLGGASLPLDLGRSQRLFSGSQRLALAQRDQGCTFPGCDRPPSWCDAHHATRPWSAGGTTNLADGALLCSYHHHYVHSHGWESRVSPVDGTPEYRPPTRRIAGPSPAPWQRNSRYRPQGHAPTDRPQDNTPSQPQDHAPSGRPQEHAPGHRPQGRAPTDRPQGCGPDGVGGPPPDPAHSPSTLPGSLPLEIPSHS